jgi:hypothetical protein
MGMVCNIINLDTGLLYIEGYIRSLGKSAVIEVTDLENCHKLHKPLKKVGIAIVDTFEVLHGFVHSVNTKSNILVVTISSVEGTESRRNLRVSLDEDCQLDIGRGSKMTCEPSFVINMSEGGFSFKSFKVFSIGDAVAYKTHKGDRKLTLCGRIVWSKQENDYLVYGVRFIRLSQEESTLVSSFVLTSVDGSEILSVGDEK